MELVGRQPKYFCCGVRAVKAIDVEGEVSEQVADTSLLSQNLLRFAHRSSTELAGFNAVDLTENDLDSLAR